MIPRNTFDNWLNKSKGMFLSKGIEFQTFREEHGGTLSIDFDTEEAVGTIVFWSPNKFEIQANSILNGETLFIKEFESENIEEFSKQLEIILLSDKSII